MLLLEEVEGRPLSEFVGKPFELSRFLTVATSLAATLAEIHGRNVIHKDLKPSNIPPVLSAIVMKLMAKVAEERYQSAEGLRADLERCRKGLRAGGGAGQARARPGQRLRRHWQVRGGA